MDRAGIARLVFLLALSARRGDGICQEAEIVHDAVYGEPIDGCCHWADVLQLYCQSNATSSPCTDRGVSGVVDATMSSWRSCEALCDSADNCKLWVFRPEEPGKPVSCRLYQQDLACPNPSCYRSGAALGRKDCITRGYNLAKDDATSPQANLGILGKRIENFPVCEAEAFPFVTGEMREGQLLPSQGCRHEVWDYDGPAQSCMRDSWTVVVGGSNAVLIATQAVNLLTGQPTMDPGRSMVFSSHIVDVIVDETGNVVHDNSEFFYMGTKWSQLESRFKAALDKAPAPKAGYARVTLFVGQYWDNVDTSIGLVEADTAWSSVPVTLVTQISQWYALCANEDPDICDRNDMKLYGDQAQLRANYRAHLTETMTHIDRFCAPGGRAGVRGCSLTSNAWVPDQWMHTANDALGNIMKELVSASSLSVQKLVRFVDFWEIGGAAGTAESMNYHSSPMVINWFWQVNFGLICRAANVEPSPKPLLKFEGTCFASEAKWSKCPDCVAGGRCDALWMCAHGSLCRVKTLTSQEALTGSAPTFTCQEGSGQLASADARRLEANAALQVTFAAADSAIDSEAPCGRVWCDADLQWVPTLLAVFFAAVAFACHRGMLWYWKKQEEAKKGVVTKVDGAGDDMARNDVVTGTQVESIEGYGIDVKGNADASVEVVDISNKEATRGPSPEQIGNGAAENADKVAGKVVEDEKEKSAQGGSETKKAADRFPLGLPRFLASLHIVAGHLYNEGSIAPAWFFGWGFTWVPWFFMLSGFVLFAAESRRPTKESVLTYVGRRTVTIYPLYAASLPIAWAIAFYYGRVPGPGYLIAQVWLLQAWIPHLTENVLQMHCWFLSCMVLYWLLFKPLAWAVKKLNTVHVIAALTCIFILPWFMVWIPAAAGDVGWYKGAKYRGTDAHTLSVVFFKFNPVCYLHVFVVGMLLARLRLTLSEETAKRLRWPIELLAGFSYLLLLLIFSIPDMSPWPYKLSKRLSTLLPLQAGVLLGLAGLPSLGPPMVAKGAIYLEFLADYSYGVYVFQFICLNLWPEEGPVSIWFFVFLIATAVLMVHLVQKPAMTFWRSYPKTRMSIPLFLTFFLPLLTLIEDPVQNNSTHVQEVFFALPEQKVYGEDMIDSRLVFSGDARDGFLMNPTVLVKDGQLLVAARRHRREHRQYNGEYQGQAAVYIDDTWHSSIELGVGVAKTSRRLQEAAGGNESMLARWVPGTSQGESVRMSAWTGLRTADGKPWNDLCVKEKWIPGNRTLIRHVVTGPEDAKLFNLPQGITITFSSKPPLGADGCGPEKKFGTVTQMYMASGVDISKPDMPVVGHHVSCGWQKLHEKNWIPFTREGKLHYIYSPEPHRIMAALEDGTCEEVYTTNFLPLKRLMDANPTYKIRGSAQAVFVDDPLATPNLAMPHYLALLHIVDEATGSYAHFAYRFHTEPPFQVLQISQELPLLAAKEEQGADKVPFAFAGGLTIEKRAVIISYGAGNRDARALVLTLEKLDAMFSCCTGSCEVGAYYRTAVVSHYQKYLRDDFGYAHGQACLRYDSTVSNPMAQSSNLGVMCCSREEQAPRICELCEGAQVQATSIAGRGCFNSSGKVFGNCADADTLACREAGGSKAFLRDFTCAELQDILVRDESLCSWDTKSLFVDNCCPGGKEAMSRRRRRESRTLQALLWNATTPLAERPRRLQACNVCLDGELQAQEMVDVGGGKQASCRDIQNHAWNQATEIECGATRTAFAASCCAAGGVRTGLNICKREREQCEACQARGLGWCNETSYCTGGRTGNIQCPTLEGYVAANASEAESLNVKGNSQVWHADCPKDPDFCAWSVTHTDYEAVCDKWQKDLKYSCDTVWDDVCPNTPHPSGKGITLAQGCPAACAGAPGGDCLLCDLNSQLQAKMRAGIDAASQSPYTCEAAQDWVNSLEGKATVTCDQAKTFWPHCCAAAKPCEICSVGKLKGSTIAGVDQGNQYTCQQAQDWKNSPEGGSMLCTDAQSFWATQCCNTNPFAFRLLQRTPCSETPWTFEDAKGYCESSGRRLCSVAEVKSGWGQRECSADMDATFIWTQDTCDPSTPPEDDKGGECDKTKCRDFGNDCCANANGGEQATCADGYSPTVQPTSWENCPNYDCCQDALEW